MLGQFCGSLGGQPRGGSRESLVCIGCFCTPWCLRIWPPSQARPPWAKGQSLRTASVLFVFLQKFPSHSESWLGPLAGNVWWLSTGVEDDWGWGARWGMACYLPLAKGQSCRVFSSGISILVLPYPGGSHLASPQPTSFLTRLQLEPSFTPWDKAQAP